MYLFQYDSMDSFLLSRLYFVTVVISYETQIVSYLEDHSVQLLNPFEMSSRPPRPRHSSSPSFLVHIIPVSYFPFFNPGIGYFSKYLGSLVDNDI